MTQRVCAPKSLLWMVVIAMVAAGLCGCDRPAKVVLADSSRDIIFRVGVSAAEDPLQAGKAAAQAAKKQIGAAPLKAVIVAECYEDKARKAKVLEGVCSVLGMQKVYGGSTYGSFTQAGVMEDESVSVLVIAGKDINVRAVCQEKMGTAGLSLDNDKDRDKLYAALRKAGADLAGKLGKKDDSRLMIVIADAHSPKNGPLVEGIQQNLGPGFAIIGGSANKNAGQTFVYFRGRMLTDSVVGLMLDGDFKVALAGRQAKENAKIISTARAGADEALRRLAKAKARPAAVLAFNCAGRKGKLDNVAAELAAMQKAFGRELVLFGTYNAGEIGPADVADKKPGVLSSGIGWHVMYGVLGW